MMEKNCLRKLLFLIPLTLFGVFLLFSTPSFAQCTLENTFPSNYSSPTSHFGAPRPGRWHAGADFFYPKGTQVRVPQGCQIRLYQDGGVIWKTDPKGYGNYMFLDCNMNGTPITLRYAHIAQYNTATSTIQQGRTGIESAGIPDHYHFEVLVNQSSNKGTPIDPECVLGIQKGAGSKSPNSFNGKSCNECPNGPGPLDFCNNGAGLQALIQHSKACYRGSDKNNPGGKTVDPSRLQGTPNQGDPNVGTEGESDAHAPGEDHGTHTHNYQDTPQGTGFTGNVDDLYPPPTPTPPPVIPEPPPPPPVPGNPGGDPTLVPTTNDPNAKLSGCAVDTWTAMVNQAVMETRREDIVNKRFIVKADSVLDYACFDKNVEIAKNSIGPIFTETKKWAALPVDIIGKIVIVKRDHGSQALDNAIDSVVKNAAQSYLNLNFNHAPLAGSIPVPTGSSGNCDVMGKVWQAAKCMNFSDEKTFNQNTKLKIFYTFDDLKNFEPREYPSNMKCDG